jgi:hypothetical protein
MEIKLKEPNELLESHVEKNFCAQFDKIKKYPMDESSSGLMISMLFSKDENDPEVAAVIADVRKQSLAFKIMESRLKGLGYDVDGKMLSFLSTRLETPGEAVMYSYFIAFKAKQAGLKRIDFQFMCSNIFPFGFPKESELTEIWDAQKLRNLPELQEMSGAENLLDDSNASKSLRCTT